MFFQLPLAMIIRNGFIEKKIINNDILHTIYHHRVYNHVSDLNLLTEDFFLFAGVGRPDQWKRDVSFLPVKE